ncbi:MAG TPA: hypothetical protein VG247_21835 [Pseudonocardiaceae bacterium]|jgi:predicted ATPase|nr:hypothetical protein [Pseudonocardiaceae bacterium]
MHNIARGGLVHMLVDLARQGTYRLITLGGPGGVGKTRVAIEVAGRLTPDFPDGVVVTELTPIRDVAVAVSTIAQAIGGHRPGADVAVGTAVAGSSLWSPAGSRLSD